MRPFEGIRIIDITHVLAGPFAAYQLALLGADVIKVEPPDDPDQSRDSGPDLALNRANMGSYFLTQGSNKRAITLDLKQKAGQEVLKKLVAGRRRAGGEFPPRRLRGAGPGLGGAERHQPAADLLFHVRLRPGRAARRADRL